MAPTSSWGSPNDVLRPTPGNWDQQQMYAYSQRGYSQALSPYERHYPRTVEEQEIINQIVGAPGVLYYDYQRGGIISESFERGRVFVSYSDIAWVRESLKSKREAQCNKLLSGSFPEVPKAKDPQCISCKKEHKVSKLDVFGRCPDRMLKLWDNMHKLYWHRYSKNKTK